MLALGIVVGCLAAFCTFIAVCLLLPLRLVPQTFPNERFEAIDKSRQTTAQIFGGAAIILTFAWTLLKDTETLDQARLQTANSEYLAAAKLLDSSGSTAERAAGIYGLGQVARARTEYSRAVRQTLVAFIANQKVINCSDDSHKRPVEKDIQAAVDVLSNRAETPRSESGFNSMPDALSYKK